MINLSADRTLIEQLTRPNPRLPELERWLSTEVWTEIAFRSVGDSPSKYLLQGEERVHARERLLTAAGSSINDELAAPSPAERTVGYFFQKHPQSSVVIFDGCSLREMPRLVELAKASRREILEVGCGRAAVPSETEYFISDRLGLGLPSLGPSEMTSRRELKERQICFRYYRSPGDHHTLPEGEAHFLLWSRFPDQRYTDSTAIDEMMFEGIWDGLEQAWRHTVQAIPPDQMVLVTSDHGYIFLGSGLSDPTLKGIDRFLDGKRFRFFEKNGSLPDPQTGLWIDRTRRLAVLAGRGHNRPQAPSASQSVYRHGGLTLMEMLPPWLILGPVK